MSRWNGDVHHDVVAARLETECEERAAFAFALGQVTSTCFDGAWQYEVQPLRQWAFSSQDEGEQVVELRNP